MTKNEILTKFFASREFNNCINRMKPAYLREDLKSEVLLILCEEEEWFLHELYTRGELVYWAVRIIMNMMKSTSSPFFEKFRLQVAELPPGYDAEDYYDEQHYRELEKLEQRAFDMIDELHWYKAELIKLYRRLGSYREVSRQTGIPFQSVQRAVRNGCKQIKKMLDERC